MNLKQTFKKDLDTFINDGEFADYWNINGKSVKAVIDNSVVNTFEKAQIQGVFKATAVVYIRQGDLSPLPLVNSTVTINKLHYICRDVQVEQGVDILTLEQMEQ